MEFDIGNLVYILFVAVIFILNLFTKAKKKRGQNIPRAEDPTTLGPPPTKGKTFEELLEEFTGSSPEPPPLPPPVQRKPTPKPKSQSVYQQQAKPKAVPETSKHSILTTDFKRFEEFDEEEVEGTDYSELFEDHDSVQKAFVLSEIFQKKY